MEKNTVQGSRGTGKPSLGFSGPGKGFPYRWLIPILVIAVPVLIVLFVIGNNPPAETPAPSPTAAATKAAAKPTNTAPPTATLDPCSPALVRPAVEVIDALMQEFYDASALASQTPVERLLLVIPSLQQIRRRADAQKVSSCLEKLHSFQVSHMNIVINTLLAFMGNSDQSVLVEGIVQARLLNEEYRKEKARLLGEVYVPPATQIPLTTPGTETLQPANTP